MRRQVFMLVAIVLGSTDAVGQEPAGPFAERALELREELTCPTEVDWPPLPETGQRVFGDAQFVGRHQQAVITTTGEAPPDPTVTVPQYGYFLNPEMT